jgi:hypothetical protein
LSEGRGSQTGGRNGQNRGAELWQHLMFYLALQDATGRT